MPSGPRICADRGDLLFLTNAEVHCGASRTPPLEPRRLRGRAYRRTVPGGAPDGPRGCARRRNPGPQPPRSVPGLGPGRPPPLPHLCARHGVRQRHPGGPGPHRLLPGSRPDPAPGSPGHSLRLGHAGRRLSFLSGRASTSLLAAACPANTRRGRALGRGGWASPQSRTLRGSTGFCSGVSNRQGRRRNSRCAARGETPVGRGT